MVKELCFHCLLAATPLAAASTDLQQADDDSVNPAQVDEGGLKRKGEKEGELSWEREGAGGSRREEC